MGPRSISDIDRHIGARLRQLRESRGYSLDKVGGLIGVTQQQISRYEKGEHRIAAAHIYNLARGLNAPISWFFENFEPNEEELKHVELMVKEKRGTWQVSSDQDKTEILFSYWKKLNSEQQSALMRLLEEFVEL